MKQLTICLLILLAAGTSFAQTSDTTKKKIANLEPSGTPVLTLKEETHNFGKIKQGEKVSYSFKFTNTGNAPLIIESTGASCGCTTPSYSKEPVMPGEDGEIVVKFDSAGKMGLQAKSVQVYYNNMERSPELITINCLIE